MAFVNLIKDFSAADITAILKRMGNGSMKAGIENLLTEVRKEAYSKGYKSGFSSGYTKGSIVGILLGVLATMGVVGALLLIKKLRKLKEEMKEEVKEEEVTINDDAENMYEVVDKIANDANMMKLLIEYYEHYMNEHELYDKSNLLIMISKICKMDIADEVIDEYYDSIRHMVVELYTKLVDILKEDENYAFTSTNISISRSKQLLVTLDELICMYQVIMTAEGNEILTKIIRRKLYDSLNGGNLS